MSFDKEIGYQRNTEVTPQDYMSVSSEIPESTVSRAVFETGAGDPSIVHSVMSATVDSVAGTTKNTTPLAQIGAATGAKFSSATNTSQLQVSATAGSLKGAGQKAEARVGAVAENKQQIGQMKQNWDIAKAGAVECLKEAVSNSAACSGMNTGDVVGAIVPKSDDSSKVSAAGVIGMEIASGGLGSFVTTAAKATYVGHEVSKEQRVKLNEGQIESLIKDAARVAQSGGPVNGTDSYMGPSSPVGEYLDAQGNGSYLAGALDDDAFKALLTENLDQQPEYLAAIDEYEALREVENQHKNVASTYGDIGTADKAANIGAVDVDFVRDMVRWADPDSTGSLNIDPDMARSLMELNAANNADATAAASNTMQGNLQQVASNTLKVA